MSLHVKGEMVRPGEGSLTQFTLEGSVPCMFPLMSGQLVRPRKPPAATLPVTDIGLLTGVGPVVGLQVAGLGVGLPAVVEGAGVDDDLPPAQPSPASLLVMFILLPGFLQAGILLVDLSVGVPVPLGDVEVTGTEG